MRRGLIFLIAVCCAREALPFDSERLKNCAKRKGGFEGTAWGTCWEEQIREDVRRAPPWEKQFHVLVFDENAKAIYISAAPFVAGNPIYVGVLAPQEFDWTLPTFDPCGIESATPNIYGSPVSSAKLNIEAPPEKSFTVFPPQRCFDTDITVTMHGTHNGNAITSDLKLKQYQRYRASLQLGALYTDRRDHSFTLRPGPGDKKLITDSGPTGKSPEYLASLVFYGLPHYFQSPSYPGRDLVHERSWQDRLGLMIGMGLSEPKKRITAGAAFELINGLNVTYSYELARVKVLNGVNVDDPFSGAASDIPLREVSKHGWVWGFTFDPRYATALFTGK